jgi:hypothetical protein
MAEQMTDWTCSRCKTTGQSASDRAPPMGWFAYASNGHIIETACSEACFRKSHWADESGYTVARVMAEPPSGTAPAPPPAIVPLTCHRCGGEQWVAQWGVSATRFALGLVCQGCAAIVRVHLAE